MRPTAFVCLFAACVAACSRSASAPEARERGAPLTSVTSSPATSSPVTAVATTQSLSVSSPAFVAAAAIPAAYTCDGGDQSPPLVIADVPNGTQSLALVVEDPDAPDPSAPKRVWVHWVAYDLPAATRSLAAGAGKHQLGRAGKNDWGSSGYRGPCPPVGRHRYFIRVYAVDRELGDLHEPNEAALLNALAGHVLASGELMGTYEKSG